MGSSWQSHQLPAARPAASSTNVEDVPETSHPSTSPLRSRMSLPSGDSMRVTIFISLSFDWVNFVYDKVFVADGTLCVPNHHAVGPVGLPKPHGLVEFLASRALDLHRSSFGSVAAKFDRAKLPYHPRLTPGHSKKGRLSMASAKAKDGSFRFLPSGSSA
jgi:hypothetical protein